jgi:hypothetical protein
MDFDLIPPGAGTTLVINAISASLVLIAVIGMWVAWSASHSSIGVTERGLELRVPFYGRTISMSKLDLANARVAALGSSPELSPTARTNGIGLPGYRAGWFRLANGMKALVALTSAEHALYIPTNEGFALLVSVQTPETVLQALRSDAT